MDNTEILKMSKQERLQTMEALWDSLVQEPAEIESPDWHGDILAERRRRIAEEQAEFISMDDLQATQDP